MRDDEESARRLVLRASLCGSNCYRPIHKLSYTKRRILISHFIGFATNYFVKYFTEVDR